MYYNIFLFTIVIFLLGKYSSWNEKNKKNRNAKLRRSNKICYIDTDRFLDYLSNKLAEKEVLQGNNDVEFYYKKEGEIEEFKEKLLEKIKDEIMVK